MAVVIVAEYAYLSFIKRMLICGKFIKVFNWS
jgi:hypothetical protein